MSQQSEEGCTYVVVDEVGEEPEESVIIIPDDIPSVTILDSDGEIDSSNEDSNSNKPIRLREISDTAGSSKNNTSSFLDMNKMAPNLNGSSIDTADLNVTPLNNSSHNKDEEPMKKSLLEVKFGDKKTYLMFQEEFLALINNKFKNRLDDLEIESNIRERHIKVIDKVVKQSDKFLIDTTPAKTTESRLEGTPIYNKNLFQNVVLSGEKEKFDDQGLKRSNRPKSICFNCDKDTHTLRDCPERRDMRKIRKNKDEFSKRSDRYHNEVGNKYGHFLPGQISDKLKDALGLRKNELPLHIYRMRLLGYPPAWLEEAKIQHSGLALYDSKGKRVLEEDEDDGEVDTPKHKYDVQRLHDFPGFNVATDFEIFESSANRKFPKMSHRDSKEVLIKSLSGSIVDGYKRKKLKNLPTAEETEVMEIPQESDETLNQVAEMEIEDDEGVMPLGVTVINVPSSPEPDLEIVQDQVGRLSPSLEELEINKRKLLAAIAESSVFLDTSTVSNATNLNETANAESMEQSSISMESHSVTIIMENSLNENKENSERVESLQEESSPISLSEESNSIPSILSATAPTNSSNDQRISIPLPLEELPPLPPTPSDELESPLELNSNSTETENKPENIAQPTVAHIPPKHLLLGTPVLPAFSPFSILPSGEQFSKGVCDVIAFENLPDSTGKYERMRSLINDVRKKVAELHKE